MSHSLLFRLGTLFTVCVLVAALLPGDGAAQGAKGKKYALLVGVSEYKGNFKPLPCAENDVEELAKVLETGGFNQVRVLTTARGKKSAKDLPTAANVRKAFEELIGTREKHDTVLIGLAGHGVQASVRDPEGDLPAKSYGYFLPYDADLTGIKYSTGNSSRLILVNEILQGLGTCSARTRLAMIDACREDTDVKAQTRSVDLSKVELPTGVAALFSCSAGQYAWESKALGAKGHGFFFHYVIEGLKGEAKNKRGVVTWDGLSA